MVPGKQARPVKLPVRCSEANRRALRSLEDRSAGGNLVIEDKSLPLIIIAGRYKPACQDNDPISPIFILQVLYLTKLDGVIYSISDKLIRRRIGPGPPGLQIQPSGSDPAVGVFDSRLRHIKVLPAFQEMG